MYEALKSAIFQIDSKRDFEAMAFEVYRYQYKRNPLYQEFAQHLKKTPDKVRTLTEIPFLPIAFFKSHPVLCEGHTPQLEFRSSGTTGKNSSIHYISDPELYKESFFTSFSKQFPDYENGAFIALLPNYIEKGDSSLLYMVDHLIKKTHHPLSGFYKTIPPEVRECLADENQKCLLIGVSYALLDLADEGMKIKNTTVLETGGMKGKRKEMIREEFHQTLKSGLGVHEIQSEYGMTELLSQAYLTDGRFEGPAWFKVLVRESTDPLGISRSGKGAANIIDLANLHSCSFIATDDLVHVHENGKFDVQGRIDNSQVRGCNLLVH